MATRQETAVLITLFGGTGDLAQRKLYPALFRLYKKGFIKHHFAVIGTARREWSDDYFRDIVIQSIDQLSTDTLEKEEFASHFYYLSHNVQNTEEYIKLKELSEALNDKYELDGNRIFYLAMAPNFFGIIADHLKSQQLLTPNGFNRLIIEKPFGKDLETAIALNEQLSHSFDESQIYRIDHYLGKEMVQNISVLRFSNLVFETLWHRNYIDNIQITLAENVGVGTRAGYYDQSGALRDMIQNHVFQILSLVAMERPKSLTDHSVREEKIKVLSHLRPYSNEDIHNDVVRGQYVGAKIDDNDLLGYLEEDNISKDSRTETFVAAKIMIDNDRWQGVPFYIRTGKRLKTKETTVRIVFKKTIANLCHTDTADKQDANVLTINVQPKETIELQLNLKELGLSQAIESQILSTVDEAGNDRIPEAYERLILECLWGNAANFVHKDEIELSWAFVDKIRQYWDNEQMSSLPTYPIGTMGPEESDQLLARDGFKWL